MKNSTKKNILSIFLFVLMIATTYVIAVLTPTSKVKAIVADGFSIKSSTVTVEENGDKRLTFVSEVSYEFINENPSSKYTFGTIIYPTYNGNVDGSKTPSENNFALDGVNVIAKNNLSVSEGFTYNASIIYSKEDIINWILSKKPELEGDEEGIESALSKVNANLYAKYFTAVSYAVTDNGTVYLPPMSACVEPVYTRDGDYIYFGYFPQTIKADNVTVSETANSNGYYEGDDGHLYAKLVATPDSSVCKFSNKVAVQKGMEYYFKVEPIKWRVLSEENGNALLFSDVILLAKAYDSESDNNYKNSELRAWLNDEFVNTSFTDFEASFINTVLVDNSLESTGAKNNEFICEDTEDLVFLLSNKDLTNSEYGLNSNEDRKLTSSDYARASGVYFYTGATDYSNGYWWTRSPSNSLSLFVDRVYVDGSMGGAINSNFTNSGVVPALQIRL